MKKLSLILAILIILALPVSCGRDRNNQSNQPSGPGNRPGTVNGNGEAMASGSGQGAQIIAKSGSSVSSKDKEAILNEISKELDAIVQSINNLDDISDSDLEF